jgi:hypothetical protein
MEPNHPKIVFLLKGIKTEQFATFEKYFKESQPNIGLSAAVQFKLLPIDKQIGVFMDFEFQQKNKPIIKLVVSCHFGIHEAHWNQLITAQTISFPKEFVMHLAALTVGTARGILSAKTESSSFSKLILPMIDVASFITEKIDFSLDS